MSQVIDPRQSQVEAFLPVNLRSIHLTLEQFELVCRDNPDLRMELTAKGELILMPPTGSKTGLRESSLVTTLTEWARKNKMGVAFGSSAGFRLPNDAIRSPDASWVKRERWESLSELEQESFAPLCPDFVLELRSPSDSVSQLQAKMTEYIENGTQLGILIDPFQRRVYIYRSGCGAQILENPANVAAAPEFPGLVFDTSELWD